LTFESRGCRGSDNVAVTPWWRNGPVATRDSWTTALGLDLDGLRCGGRRILEDGGDLATLLFRARTGVDVTQAIETLTARSEAAYKRRANVKVQIRTLLAEATRTHQDTADATSSAAEVERLREEATRLQALSQTAEAALAEREVAHAAAEEGQRAWEPAVKLLSARNHQSQFRALGRVLDTTDLDAYDQARQESIALTRQLAEVDEELTTSTDG
jgi:AAA domain